MYGPVRTVVWQGSAGNRRPYADLTAKPENLPRKAGNVLFADDQSTQLCLRGNRSTPNLSVELPHCAPVAEIRTAMYMGRSLALLLHEEL